jgi:FkbM family methyltransferase
MDKLFKYINPKRVLDIGANVGNFGKNIYYKFPECEIIMIEANPNCKPYLQLLEIPFKIIGISDEKGIKDFYVEKSNNVATGPSFYKENTEFYSDDKYDVVKIETDTLDNLNFYSEKLIDLTKIDVQGSELDILLGGEKTIKNSKFVLMELSLLEYNIDSPSIEKVFDKMINYGFFVKDILEYHRSPSMCDGLIFQIDMLFENYNF